MMHHGEISTQTKKQLQASLRNHFLPEFLNRLDDLCIFSPLSQESLVKILEQQVEVATARLRSPDKNITVSLDPSASTYLLQVGYDPLYGARPLRRLVEQMIITQLSQLIVEGQILPNSVVRVEALDIQGQPYFKYIVQGPNTADFLQPLNEDASIASEAGNHSEL